jgi:hypothetical protein
MRIRWPSLGWLGARLARQRAVEEVAFFEGAHSEVLIPHQPQLGVWHPGAAELRHNRPAHLLADGL